MTMLMKMGTLGQTSGEDQFVDGLGIGQISQSQMSKFKKILNNLTKSEKSFSNQFIRELLDRPSKIDSDDDPVSSGLINFLYNKAESGEEIDIEIDLLEGLMQQFIRHSLATGGPIAFEVENESYGKIAVKFDPESKKLSIASEISGELAANTGFVNIFSDLGIESIEFVDSKKLSSLGYSSTDLNGKTAKSGGSNLLAFKGLVNDFSEIKDGVKRLVEEPGLLEKTNLSKKSTLSGKKDVASLIGTNASSGKTDHLEKNPKLVNVAAKSSIKQKEFSDAIINSIKPDNAEKPKVSQAQAVETIKNTVTQSKFVFSGKSAGKFQVTMNVAEKGVLTVSSQKNNDTVATHIQVETQSAKDWLKSALAKKGITVDNISVRAKSDSPKTKNEVADKMASIESVEQRQNKTNPGVEKLAAKLNQASLNGSKVEHTVKAVSDQTAELLEKELRPIADEVVKQELQVSKVTVVKEASVKSSLKPELALINQEPPDAKPIGKDAKQKTALSSINLLNSDETSGDEEEFSGGSQFSKNGSQLKENLTVKELQGAEFKMPLDRRADGSQVVNMSTANGQVQFDAVNGKLVSAQKLDSSNMPEMLQKIAELAQNQTNLSSHKLEVQMDIKDVGKVMVDALRHADGINLQIQVESSEARRILETQLRPFIEQMAKDGIDIGKLDVSVRDERQENQMARDFSENATQDRQEKQVPEAYQNFFSGFESEAEIRQDFERKQVRQKVTGNQTLEIWA